MIHKLSENDREAREAPPVLKVFFFFRERSHFFSHSLSFLFLSQQPLSACCCSQERQPQDVVHRRLEAGRPALGHGPPGFEVQAQSKGDEGTTTPPRASGVDDVGRREPQCKSGNPLTPPLSPSFPLQSPNIFDSTEIYEEGAPIGTGGKGCRGRPAERWHWLSRSSSSSSSGDSGERRSRGGDNGNDTADGIASLGALAPFLRDKGHQALSWCATAAAAISRR